MKNIALFFGAGAECSYGLPSGGKFALDIFRMDTLKDKEAVKNQINNIDLTSRYSKWLPDDIKSKKLTAFTKGQYDSLVKGSLENKRNHILEYLKNFDDNVGYIVEKLSTKKINIDEIIEKILGESIGTYTYGKEIKLNHIFDEGFNDLFSSEYFSAFLRAMQLDGTSYKFKNSLKNITRAILELLIGSIGEELTHRLNDGIFEKSPDSIDLFDDLGSIFILDYKNTGMKGLELLIESEDFDIEKLTDDEEIIVKFGLMILEDIYSRALDYQTLIDMNWRYIYNPQTDWGKFSKIVIFLHTVRRYISNIAVESKSKIDGGNGYYHDILQLKKNCNISSIGTTNYNTFIEEVIGTKVAYLNGCVDDYYDPYLNKIISLADNANKKHIIVPFLFTQSGIKPLTSVKMSERYVELFNRFKEADIIVVCGFGFNADDGHINGMFRELIQDYNKQITIIHLAENGTYKEKNVKNYYRDQLRLDSIDNINIIPVNRERKDINKDEIWYNSLEL
ncbi:hypothetical protein [Clostridium neonatale]|uniref:hypothetical protein n=1 Tax=Clostridium neonatale TaxID=137838 RepID=UPI00291BFE5E|nr:hypothetical protein [Clostridium neonatale]CAI3245401.1 conserved hypothetical protein [Clostridium neonatale]CAI3587577.1 conserved hypothetical protein [Clostridium neonatale]CAI3627920.1 conserved hypothetical protein [Clostridium neonatale]CAI3634420.1 conserved hypothetical protein [Clostridium neonatale]CAI3673292.1 conserved hypothetical protein [Clostridium neonatale]